MMATPPPPSPSHPPLFACLGLGSADVPASHLTEWLRFHRAVGVTHVFASQNDEAKSELVAALRLDESVTLLPRSTWPWTHETTVLFDVHAKFVGQLEFLNACVAAASTMALQSDGEAFLANLDLDEFLMPERAILAARSRSQRLPRVLAGAFNSTPLQCLSVRRHNFYCPDGEVGYSLERNHSNKNMRPPLHERVWRAPFPPWPLSGQPYLAKWVLRLPAGPNLVVNQHEAYYAEACQQRCAPSAASASSAGAQPSASTADPAGLAEVVRSLRGGARSDALPWAGALLASLAAPLASPCYLPEAAIERCVLSGRVHGRAALPLAIAGNLSPPFGGGRNDSSATGATTPLLQAAMLRCLARSNGVNTASRASFRLPSWCWRDACARGGAAESWVRIHHYASPSTQQQRTYRYALEKSGEPEEDSHALKWMV